MGRWYSFAAGLLGIILSPVSTPCYASPPIRFSGAYLYHPQTWNEAQLEMDLHLVRFDFEVWSAREIHNHLQDLSQIYSQCALRFREIQIIDRFDLKPERLSRFNTKAPDGYETFGLKLNELPRPLVLLIDDFYDATPSSAFALADFKPKVGDTPLALFNTVWLPDYVNSEEYKRDRENSPYSVLAHELLHILTLEGQHNADQPGNLLSIWRRRNNLITPEQCEWVRKSNLVHSRPVQTNSAEEYVF